MYLKRRASRVRCYLYFSGINELMNQCEHFLLKQFLLMFSLWFCLFVFPFCENSKNVFFHFDFMTYIITSLHSLLQNATILISLYLKFMTSFGTINFNPFCKVNARTRRLSWISNSEYYWWASLKYYIIEYKSKLLACQFFQIIVLYFNNFW